MMMGWPADELSDPLQQLAADPLGAPAHGVARHNGDQLACLATEPQPADWAAAPPPPEQPPALAMPPDDRLRSDDDQVRPPVMADGADHHPETPVPDAEPRLPASGPRQDGELLAQDEVLGHEVRPAAKRGADEADEEEQVLEHGPVIMSRNRTE